MRYMGRPGHRAGSPLSVPVERRRALAWLLVTGGRVTGVTQTRDRRAGSGDEAGAPVEWLPGESLGAVDCDQATGGGPGLVS